MADNALIQKGRAAAALLKSEDFKATVEAVQLQAFQGWSRTQPEQTKEREEFYFLLLATNKLLAFLEEMVSSGKFEERKAAEKEARAKAGATRNL